MTVSSSSSNNTAELRFFTHALAALSSKATAYRPDFEPASADTLPVLPPGSRPFEIKTASEKKAAPGVINFFVKQLKGSIQNVSYSTTTNVATLKSDLAKTYFKNIGPFRLVHNGKVLKDYCDLSDQGVEQGDTLLVFEIPGWSKATKSSADLKPVTAEEVFAPVPERTKGLTKDGKTKASQPALWNRLKNFLDGEFSEHDSQILFTEFKKAYESL